MTGLISKDDTKWVICPYSSSFKKFYDDDVDGLLVRKENHIVNIVGTITPTASISGSDSYVNITASPLSSEFRPIEPVRVIEQGNGGYLYLCNMDTDGYVKFSRYRVTNSYASCAASTQLFVNLIYMTAD